MAEKSNGKRNGHLKTAHILGHAKKLGARVLGGLTPLEVLTGIGICLLITLLLVGYQFQNIPDYKVGDIADQTIEAPQDLEIEDPEATAEKQQRVKASVPAVFELDLRINRRVESEIRSAFGLARQLISQERRNADLAPERPLPKDARTRILDQLQQRLPRELWPTRSLEILLDRSFSAALETQLVRLLAEAMKYPGVIENRDQLFLYRNRGIVLRNSVTNADESVSDWTSISDTNRARDNLRQNEFELTAVSGEEKKNLIAFVEKWVRANVRFSEEATLEREMLALELIDPALFKIKKGRTLIRAGDEVTASNVVILKALKRLKQPHRLLGKFFGILLIVAFFMLAVWLYLSRVQKKHLRIRNHYLLIATILTLTLVVTKVFVALGDLISGNVLDEALQNPLHFYFLAPAALGAILIILLLDANVAILFSLVFSVFVGLLTGQIAVSVHALTGSLVAVYVLDHYRERLAIIRAGLIIGLASACVVLALQFYGSTGTSWTVFLIRTIGALLSGLIGSMLASLLLPILESLFEVTTDIRLLELSNLNKPILRRLAVEAPGTYHHSIVVGTLAEAAAEAIGANPLLVRVGAYYHDIGKLKKASYYVENQIYTANKHENLTPNMSSLILASHVKDGLAMAEEIGLARKVRDMIPQHHGTRLMTYFYQKARDAADEKHRAVSEDDFRYPGPKPQSREAAILMLADQVEAAARTLQDPNPGQIESLIRRLVQATIQDGQFDECDITLKDLDEISSSFQRVIAGIHHHRIEYPGFKFNSELEEKRTEHQRIQ